MSHFKSLQNVSYVQNLPSPAPFHDDEPTKSNFQEYPVPDTKSNKTSNVFYTSANISNSIVGSGVVTLSYALGLSGPGMGMLLIIISATMSGYTIGCMAKAGCISKKTTYQGFVKAAFGNIGMVSITICHALIPIFACMSYGIAVADSMQDVVSTFAEPGKWYASKPFLLSLPTILMIIPLSSLPNLSFLAKFSSASLCFVIFYVITIAYFAMTNTPIYIFSGLWSFAYRDILRSMGVFAYAMNCHYSIMPLFISLKNCSVERFSKASNCAIGFTIIIYMIVSYSGFINFSGQAQGNLFNNYCTRSIPAIMARAVFCVTIILTVPLNAFAIRETLSYFFKFKKSTKTIFNITIGILCAFIFYIPGAANMDLGLVGELAGSLSAAPMIFIFPTASLLKLYGAELPITSPRKMILIIILIFGVYVQIVGTIMSIKDALLSKPQFVRYWCSETEITTFTIPDVDDKIKKAWTPITQGYSS